MRPLCLALVLLVAPGCADAPTEARPAEAPPTATDGPPTAETAAPATEPADGPRSVYTDLDLDACEVLAEYEEGGSVDLLCPGYDGIPLYVSEGDLRFDVDAGVPNDRWESQMGFNSLGERVEWRLDEAGDPYAIILRFYVDNGMGEPDSRFSELAVISVGSEGEPGCLVGWVPGDAAPSQNEAARALADRVLDGSAGCYE